MFPVPLAFWGAQSSVSISPAVGALAITGQPPIVIAGRAIFPSAGALAFTGQAPIVTTGAGNIARTPSAGSLSIIGQAPIRTIAGNQSATPSVGSLHFTGQAPVVTVTTPLAFFFDGALTNSSSSTTISYTVVSTIPAGRLVVVMFGCRGNIVPASTTATDSSGNTYTFHRGASNVSSNTASEGFLFSRITSGLTAGSTITVTVSMASGGVSGSAMLVGSVANTGVSQPDLLAGGNATGNSTAISLTGGATTNAADIVFSAACSTNTTQIGPASGWTAVGTSTGYSFASGNNFFGASYKILSATGAQTYTPTSSTSSRWAASQVAYKGA